MSTSPRHRRFTGAKTSRAVSCSDSRHRGVFRFQDRLFSVTAEDPDGYDLLPEKKLLLRLTVPYVGEKIASYLQECRDRQEDRAAEFQDAALKEAQLTPEEFLDRLTEDERLSELFWFAMESRSTSKKNRP